MALFCHLYSQAIDQTADPLVFSTSQHAGEYKDFVKQVCDLVAYAQVASTLLSAEQTAADEDFVRILSNYQERLSTIASNSCEWVSECSQSGNRNEHVNLHAATFLFSQLMQSHHSHLL